MDRSLEEDFGDFVDAASPRLLGLAWNLGGVEHEARTWCRPSSGSMSGGGRWSFPPRSWLRPPRLGPRPDRPPWTWSPRSAGSHARAPGGRAALLR